MFLKTSQNSQETPAPESLFNKVVGNACNAGNFIKKETLAQVLSYEFREILKNNFFYRTPPVAASEKDKIFPIFLK